MTVFAYAGPVDMLAALVLFVFAVLLAVIAGGARVGGVDAGEVDARHAAERRAKS